MKILHISASHANKKAHAFSYHFKQTCKALGHSIVSLSPFSDGIISKNIDFRFGEENYKDYHTGKTLFPLSRILRDYPTSDIIFIENPKFPFGNDVDVPVVYYHRDLKSKAYVPRADFFLIRFNSFDKTPDGRPRYGQPELLELYHPEIWYNDEIKKIWLCHAISEVEFGELALFRKSQENVKRRSGFAYLGSYKSVREMIPFNTVHTHIYQHHLEITDYVKDHDLAVLFKEVNVSLDKYKKHLFKYDATLVIPAYDSWETRRLYEASYCKCVPLLYIQNEAAKVVFEKQGYVHDETCITFTKKEELLDLDLNDYDLEAIREAGFKLVKKRHTYVARVKELLDKIDYKKIERNNKLRRQIK